MLRYGIPGYRLSEEVLDTEIQRILDLGVELHCGVKVGKDVTLAELKEEFDAVYVALGAQQGVSLGVEGEDAPNVFSGVDFLNRFHHGEKLDLGKDVVAIVVGGGDTAIDAARICRRLGANVTVLYRRTLEEMPAIKEEVEEAIRGGRERRVPGRPRGLQAGRRRAGERHGRHPDGARRARRLGAAPSGADRGLGVRDPGERGHLRGEPASRLRRLRRARGRTRAGSRSTSTATPGPRTCGPGAT